VSSEKKYPARTKRDTLICMLKEENFWGVNNSKKVVVAGRVIGILDDGFVLQDHSGRVDIVYTLGVNVGDIVETKIQKLKKTNNEGKEVESFVARGVNVLAPCVSEYFIRKEDDNYKKIVIDKFLQEKMDKRIEILEGIRNFFRERKFVEIETPLLVKLPGMEPYLDPFKTQFITQAGSQSDMFLITSPEYAMKKILVTGQEKIFQICKSFRNRETDSDLHNPEFTLLEWYQSYASYMEIMEDTEDMVEYLAKQINGEALINYQNAKVDVSTPWPRKTVKEVFKEYAGVDDMVLENEEELRRVVREKGYKVDDETSYEDLFFKIFMNEIEPKLGFDRPVIVHEYPVSMAALSKKCEKNSQYAERFEVYIAGVELCNAFTELNDPIEQKERLEEEHKQRIEMGKEDYPVDLSFISALEFGMPPSGGNALGVDRLVMLLTDTPDIRDIIYFPHRDL